MNKEEREEFFNQIDEMYKHRSQEMLDSFLVAHEQSKDEFRIYQDQINTLNTTVNSMNATTVSGFKSVKEDLTFVKDYLIKNLDQRVNVLESVTLK